MGNRTVELEKMGKVVLFAYEEAIGFMCGSKVRDKDGISAGMHIAELSAYLETMGLTLHDLLNEIYTQYAIAQFTFEIFIWMNILFIVPHFTYMFIKKMYLI